MVASPKAILAELRRRKFTLTITAASRLNVQPASVLTPTDRGFLTAHSKAIVALLEAEQPVWNVLDSTDPDAIGGRWIGNQWHPPTRSQ